MKNSYRIFYVNVENSMTFEEIKSGESKNIEFKIKLPDVTFQTIEGKWSKLSANQSSICGQAGIFRINL